MKNPILSLKRQTQIVIDSTYDFTCTLKWIQDQYRILLLVLTCLIILSSKPGVAQNSMVGDGFGGLPEYVPVNFNVGSYSAYAICPASNNQLYVWGSNNSGQLGNGTIAFLQNSWDVELQNPGSNTPKAVPGMDDVKFYSVGYLAAVIKKDGTAWAWGDKYNEGKGLTLTPVKYMSDVKHVDGGASHILFVKNNGTVWTAGENTDYFFGPGTTNNPKVTTPVQMHGINTAVRAATGNEGTSAFSVVLLNDGTVKYTANTFAYINPEIAVVNVNTPSTVPGLSDIVDVKANREAAYALKRDGTVYSWGNGFALGRLPVKRVWEGIDHIPAKIDFPFVDGGSKIIAISTRNDGICVLALDDKGNVYGWGDNYWGQLGIGSMQGRQLPVLVATNAVDILMGETFSYIVKDGNKLFGSGMSYSVNEITYSGNSYYLNDNVFMTLPNKPLMNFTELSPTSSDWVNPTMCPVVVMPLKLIDFTVQEQGSNGKLSWNTTNEEGVSYFSIERSNDGVSFVEIGKVSATGARNSIHTYSFTNEVSENNIYYYRLKIIDYDGQYTYSPIRILNLGKGSKILAYPNPVGSLLTLTGLHGESQIKVLSVDGRTALTQKLSGNASQINVGNISAGIYILQIFKNGTLTNVLKFTKQ